MPFVKCLSNYKGYSKWTSCKLFSGSRKFVTNAWKKKFHSIDQMTKQFTDNVDNMSWNGLHQLALSLIFRQYIINGAEKNGSTCGSYFLTEEECKNRKWINNQFKIFMQLSSLPSFSFDDNSLAGGAKLKTLRVAAFN